MANDNGEVRLSQADRDIVIGIGKEFQTEYRKEFGVFEGKVTTFTSEAAEKIDKLTSAMDELQKKYEAEAKARLGLEKQIADSLAQMQPPKSIGDQVVTDAEMLKYGKSGHRGGYTVAVKRMPQAWGAKDIVGLSQVMPAPLNQVGVGPRLPFGVRSLCPQGRTTAGAVEYFRETSFTNNAGPVVEGQKKPQSDKTFDPITAVIRTIAHYFKVSQQTWDDLPFLASLIESNGIYGVQIREDAQLLNGTGVAPQMEGFNKNAVVAPAGAVGSSLVDAVGLAFFDLAAKGYLPDGTVVNPLDWGVVALSKNSQGSYIYANPMDYSGVARLWGTKLVMSSNQVAGTFLVGAFQGNCQIVDRDDVNVQISNQNEDDFVKNMYTVLIEERMVLAIFQNAAFEKGVVPAAAVGLGATSSSKKTSGE